MREQLPVQYGAQPVLLRLRLVVARRKARMKVLISGAGIAGPCLAYWLARRGHEPTIIERAPWSPRWDGLIRGAHVGVGQDEDRVLYEQAQNNARHYSALRFAMFSIYSVISGALLSVDPGKAMKIPSGAGLFAFRVFALALVVTFGLLEWRVATLVAFYQERANELSSREKDELHEKHERWKWAIPRLMVVPFVLAGLLWLALLFIRRTEYAF